MRLSMTKPCAKCPFRYDIPPYLPISRVREIVSTLTVKDQTFSCHNTNDFDEDEGYAIETSESQHCAGAMIFLMANDGQNGGPNQWMRTAGRLGLFDASKLDYTAPVYDSLEDWIDAIIEDGSEYLQHDEEEDEGVYC